MRKVIKSIGADYQSAYDKPYEYNVSLSIVTYPLSFNQVPAGANDFINF